MEDQLQKAKDAAYRYLSYRARSVAEVRDKLKEKEFAAEIVAEVIADLQRQQLLDDREFARRWVEARLPRAYGARKLAQDLRHKGVATGVIDEVIAEYAGV
ncbi:MAG: RecX family transcriptional regulator, partial [Gemmatimonadetes bacterium]|nr:RecX family transcriptional regulator [Gemmatimonadota bacterium]